MSDIEVQAYRLMAAGRLAEALPLAQSVVARQRGVYADAWDARDDLSFGSGGVMMPSW